MNIFEPKNPDDIAIGAQFVMLFTFNELFAMHADLSAIKDVYASQDRFMEYMEMYDIEPIGEFDMSVTPRGFDDTPPKRMMNLDEYRTYWQTHGREAALGDNDFAQLSKMNEVK